MKNAPVLLLLLLLPLLLCTAPPTRKSAAVQPGNPPDSVKASAATEPALAGVDAYSTAENELKERLAQQAQAVPVADTADSSTPSDSTVERYRLEIDLTTPAGRCVDSLEREIKTMELILFSSDARLGHMKEMSTQDRVEYVRFLLKHQRMKPAEMIDVLESLMRIADLERQKLTVLLEAQSSGNARSAVYAQVRKQKDDAKAIADLIVRLERGR